MAPLRPESPPFTDSVSLGTAPAEIVTTASVRLALSGSATVAVGDNVTGGSFSVYEAVAATPIAGASFTASTAMVAVAVLLSPDRKSTRLNSSHLGISYAVFCLKKKKKQQI